MIIDEVTGQRVSHSKHSGDMVWDVVGDTQVSKQDKEITPNRQNMMNVGRVNKNQFSRAPDEEDKTERGNRKNTHTSVRIKRYKKLS